MRNIQIAASVFNLPPALILAGSDESLSKNLDEAGYEHMQYMPVRGLHPHAAEALVSNGVITSFHQAWLNVQNGSPFKDKLMRMVFPGIESSMRKIDDLEEQAPGGTRLPIVVHPYGQHLGGRPAYHSLDYSRLSVTGNAAPLIHQPTAEVLDLWGVLGRDGAQTAERMIEVHHERGLAGVALDLHHLTTVRGGVNLDQYGGDWRQDFVGALAAYGGLGGPSELQVSLRPDFGGDPEHLSTFLDGAFERSPHGRMLLAIAESLPEDQETLRVTTEVPPSAWQSTGHSWKLGNTLLVSAIQSSPLAG